MIRLALIATFLVAGVGLDAAPQGRVVEGVRLASRLVPAPADTVADLTSVRLSGQNVRLPRVPAGVFHGASVLVDPADVEVIGAIGGLVAPSSSGSGTSPQIQPHDEVYVTGSGALAPGDRVRFVRLEAAVVPYGRIHRATGGGIVLTVRGDAAVVEVDRFHHRVEVGDLVVAEEPPPDTDSAPQPATGLFGMILAFEVSQPLPATQDLLFIDLGEASGVEVGDEFEVFMAPEAVEWGTRPDVVLARLQVVRTTRLTSTARVLALEHPVLRTGLPVRVIAMMP